VLVTKARARVDVKDSGGFTPLMMAAREEHEAAVRALLDAGADRGVMNSENKTAEQLAANETIRELLRVVGHMIEPTNLLLISCYINLLG
jgi:ankyrin repeat protein